jgi:hypothetical protein
MDGSTNWGSALWSFLTTYKAQTLPAPAPAAPQTESQMKTWTPADAAAAQIEAVKNWSGHVLDNAPGTPDDNGPNWYVIGAIAGALGLLIVVERVKR